VAKGNFRVIILHRFPKQIERLHPESFPLPYETPSDRSSHPIERMYDSTEYFGFSYSKEIPENHLEELAKGFKSARREGTHHSQG
jgi:hypothetical protein